jgi:O-antigen/teichoic acid export membrane protein
MNTAAHSPDQPGERFATAVRRAVIWRSGSSIVAQAVQWAATFLVIRILEPADYGLFAMTQVVLVLLNMLNGYGLASGLIRRPDVTDREIRQLFGMLILLNGGLALAQFGAAGLVARYYRHPELVPLLRTQALLYLTTPFAALAFAMLSRRMEYRGQAWANIAGSIASAATALGGALAGWGVWTLVVAPLVLFGVRAVMLTVAARSLVVPSFDFRGAGHLAAYGGVVALGQVFWFVQTQADVFIGGRNFGAHMLGIYTTALFLTQIFVSKVVPPLNEVAFSAYARMQDGEDGALGRGFLHAVLVVMAAGLPFHLGLAATAEPLVLAMLGAKWAEAVPVVRLLAFAMPFMTLLVLIGPACEARGRPGITVLNGAVGAVLLVGGFLLAAPYGPTGLAWAWIAAYPLYLAFSLWRGLPVIGVSPSALAGAVLPALGAAIAMWALVTLVDAGLPPIGPATRLAILVAVGAAAYGLWLFVWARPTWRALVATIRR